MAISTTDPGAVETPQPSVPDPPAPAEASSMSTAENVDGVDEVGPPALPKQPWWAWRPWPVRAMTAAERAARARERARRWRPVRWIATAGWVVLLAAWIWTRGVPFDREGLILWMSGGMFAASIGRRAPWAVIIDWLPFALVLIAYDFARGASQKLNKTTQWTPQITVDRWLFGGHEPTVWLQQHFEETSVRWWDAGVSLVYSSFFLLPYVLAAVLWVRSRGEFYRWAGRFVALSFLGVAGFILFPAAPPWAAARCAAADVVKHPAYPTCIYGDPSYVNGGLLGRFNPVHSGVAPYVERLSGRGFSQLHIPVASALLNKGQGTVDLVAAIPSLHAGITLLVVLFLWNRMRLYWKVLGVVYVVAMAFSLVYSGEHYFVDVLVGWILAALVMIIFGQFDRRRARRRPLSVPGLGPLPSYAGRIPPAYRKPAYRKPAYRKPADRKMETLCPPIETTPSSA